MVNVGENRARNGVTDCPESRNEEKIEKWTKTAWGDRTRERFCKSGSSVYPQNSVWIGNVLDIGRLERFNQHRPRSSRKCDMKVPAAVGQNMSTAVKGAATAYDDPSSTCRDDYRRHHRRHRDIAPATLRRDIAPATRDDDDRLPTQRRLCKFRHEVPQALDKFKSLSSHYPMMPIFLITVLNSTVMKT
ncbi:hypothetical protein E3N88_01461 [Mikania micrantha]|uniref:Uncharacterized protein n=1 Tax=Mikania micrantha TaxID=192012 RepID=A0A5N6Q112_9ASTR|nr:hypothetical protein E3N88_01461 [Mikania micrantha]